MLRPVYSVAVLLKGQNLKVKRQQAYAGLPYKWNLKVWNEELQEYEPERIYQTHQELRTDLGMQVAWLRQCAYELKQENEQLKAELAAIKTKLGME